VPARLFGRLAPALLAVGLLAHGAHGAHAQIGQIAQIALPVEVIEVVIDAVPLEMSMTGVAQAPNRYAASFPSGGRVISVSVQPGDVVRAGDELARIDPTQQTQSLRAAQADLRAADAGLIRAEQDFARQSALIERGAVTRTDVDDAREALQSAEAARAQAATQVGKAEKAMADTVLKAPQGAVVTSRNAEAGEVVAAAQSIVDLADPTERDAVFLAPDDMPPDGVLGARLTLHLLDGGAPAMLARITEISPLVDPATGSVAVRARIDAPPAGVSLLGEPVDGRLTFTLPPVARIPWTALTASTQGMAVWIVSPADMSVALTPVQVDRFSADAVFISGGLAVGALVVGRGSQLLYPGRIVRDAGGAAK
jgi:RND family efflux transporter MFP subunit